MPTAPAKKLSKSTNSKSSNQPVKPNQSARQKRKLPTWFNLKTMLIVGSALVVFIAISFGLGFGLKANKQPTTTTTEPTTTTTEPTTTTTEPTTTTTTTTTTIPTTTTTVAVTTSTSTSTTRPQDEKKGLSGGAGAVIAIVVIVVIAAIFGGVLYIRKKGNSNDLDNNESEA